MIHFFSLKIKDFLGSISKITSPYPLLKIGEGTLILSHSQLLTEITYPIHTPLAYGWDGKIRGVAPNPTSSTNSYLPLTRSSILIAIFNISSTSSNLSIFGPSDFAQSGFG